MIVFSSFVIDSLRCIYTDETHQQCVLRYTHTRKQKHTSLYIYLCEDLDVMYSPASYPDPNHP